MSKEINTNIVIIGGGAAGLTAAVNAYEHGEKEIIILEKSKAIGGGGRGATGIGGIGTPAQERLGVKWDIDKEFVNYMNWCHWKTDAKLIRTYLENCANFFRWAEKRGLVFQAVIPTKPKEYGESRVCHALPSTGETIGGPAAINLLIKVVKEYDIPCYCNVNPSKILVENGRVAGVEAEIAGETTVIHAKCVMVATGNFGGNKELTHKHWPNYRGEAIDYIGVPHLTGEGLKLVGEAGGRIQDEVDFWSVGPCYTVHVPVAYAMGYALKWPQALWINKYGERFVDESLCARTHTLGANALNLQQEKKCFSLFDAEMCEEIIVGEKFDHENPNYKNILKAKNAVSGKTEVVGALTREALEKEIAAGRTYRADTWKELAQKINVDPAVLLETVNRYNADCDAGHDSEMCKDPQYLKSLKKGPFYAVPGAPAYDLSIGGIVINHKMQVLHDTDLRPLPGLYAAGDCAWNGFVVSGLVDYWTPLSTALTLGGVAGENMAKEIAALG